MKTYLTDFGKDVKKVEESDKIQMKNDGEKEKSNSGQSAHTSATFGLFGVKKGEKSGKEEKENKNRKLGESQGVEVGTY